MNDDIHCDDDSDKKAGHETYNELITNVARLEKYGEIGLKNEGCLYEYREEPSKQATDQSELEATDLSDLEATDQSDLEATDQSELEDETGDIKSDDDSDKTSEHKQYNEISTNIAHGDVDLESDRCSNQFIIDEQEEVDLIVDSSLVSCEEITIATVPVTVIKTRVSHKSTEKTKKYASRKKKISGTLTKQESDDKLENSFCEDSRILATCIPGDHSSLNRISNHGDDIAIAGDNKSEVLICKDSQTLSTPSGDHSNLSVNSNLGNYIPVNGDIELGCSLCEDLQISGVANEGSNRSDDVDVDICLHTKKNQPKSKNGLKLKDKVVRVSTICEFCGRDCKDKYRLKRHLACHSDILPYNCKLCEKKFRFKDNLSKHHKVHLGRDKGEKSHICDICSKTFVTKGGLRAHLFYHSGARPFLCSECPEKFTTKGYLAVHMLRHSGELPYKCDLCSLAFRHSGTLTKHRRTHTGERPFQCEDCGKSFTQKTSLVAHMKIHNESRSFVCVSCGKSFLHQFSLKTHMKIHSGEKRFTCLFCSKAFTQKIHLLNHERTHTNERPYECDKCGCAFKQITNLKSHQRTGCHSRLRNQRDNQISKPKKPYNIN